MNEIPLCSVQFQLSLITQLLGDLTTSLMDYQNAIILLRPPDQTDASSTHTRQR